MTTTQIADTDVLTLPTLANRPNIFYVPKTSRAFNGLTGKRKQVPLMCALALTVHKAQGLTLPAVILDFTTAPVGGKLPSRYVALSRTTRLDNIHLLGKPTTVDFVKGAVPDHLRKEDARLQKLQDATLRKYADITNMHAGVPAAMQVNAPDMAHIPFVGDDGDDDGYLADMLISPSASPAPTMLETPAIDTDTLHAPDYSQADDDEWDSDFADNLVLPGNSSPATMCDPPNMSSSEHSDDDKQYDFSHIVSHKGGKHKREYRVRFVGYTQDNDLWFKEADLRMTASEAVDAYEKQLKKRGRKHTK